MAFRSLETLCGELFGGAQGEIGPHELRVTLWLLGAATE